MLVGKSKREGPFGDVSEIWRIILKCILREEILRFGQYSTEFGEHDMVLSQELY
jgi:hypothetical protein